MKNNSIIELSRRHISFLYVPLTIAFLLLLPERAAAVTKIDFEDFTPGTIIKSQYGPRGVIFPNLPVIVSDRTAHSGSRVLFSAPPSTEFDGGSLNIQFTDLQRRVSFFARSAKFGAAKGTLRALDALGKLVAEDSKIVSADGFTTQFTVSVTTASIIRVEFKIGVSNIEAIDDLEFEGDSTTPVPRDPPVVQINLPVNGSDIDTDTLAIAGTVSGEGLLLTATLTLVSKNPPEITAPPFSVSIPLTPTGTATVKTFNTGIPGLALGPLILTVEAENTAGLKGSATSRFTNLPALIRQRFTAEGGASTFGAFQFGNLGSDCKIAIYESGAIAQVNTTSGLTTRLIRGDVFLKWRTLRDPFSGKVEILGCPKGERRTIIAGADAQDFEKGRIYAHLPSGGVGHYVLNVFTDAIDKLGGEIATGLPIEDPREGSSLTVANPTWLFQRFKRPGQPGLPSTLEIKGLEIMGVSPRLWVERQGGNLAELGFIGAPLTENSPTIWQDFPCDGKRGPCTVTPPLPREGIKDAGLRFCDNCLLYPVFCPGTPQWKGVKGNYDLTPMLGIVQFSFRAPNDNPATHDCFDVNVDIPCAVASTLISPLAATVVIPAVCTQYASDWNIHVRPLPEYTNLFANNTDNVEVEIELCNVNQFFFRESQDGNNIDGNPQPGDLLFTSGRLIIDCGHPTFRSEIHPPFVMARMRTEMFRGLPATRASIWVNGFYTGDPVSLDIFPPPRPSPDATLHLVRFLYEIKDDIKLGSSGLGVTKATASFTASKRQVKVTNEGQMLWESGRTYRAKWYLYWQ